MSDDCYTIDIMNRCTWVNLDNPLYVRYHDTEWGVPVYNDRKLFEFLILESAQAGLSWETILNRRAGYRKAFAGFDPKKVSKFTKKDVTRLMQDSKIIRNKLKIKSTITNAQAFLIVQREFNTFSQYMWQWMELDEKSEEIAKLVAKDMKKRGFRFFGSTICYAYMQAVGMVDDHTKNCFKYKKLSVGKTRRSVVKD